MYKAGSSFQGGTLLQLRSLVNRRNVSGDTSGKFNATIDFFQLVVECHILVAAMHFFAMKTLDSTPSKNALPLLDGKNNDEKWSILRQRITKLINRYVLVDQVASGLNRESEHKDVGLQSAQQLNPHISRIASEHCYTLTHHARVAAEHSYTQPDVKKKTPASIVDARIGRRRSNTISNTNTFARWCI